MNYILLCHNNWHMEVCHKVLLDLAEVLFYVKLPNHCCLIIDLNASWQIALGDRCQVKTLLEMSEIKRIKLIKSSVLKHIWRGIFFWQGLVLHARTIQESFRHTI